MTTVETPQTPRKCFTPTTAARTALVILFVMNLLNYIDRSILNSVLPLVKDEWAISDKMLGILNSAFIITYMVFSPIFGWLGDRMVRKWIAAGGIVVWSITTAASGLARNFAQLFGLRMLFGTGEAGFSTVAPTMIADFYPSAVRSRVLSVFYVAIPVGYALGYIIGGAIGGRYGWRAVFPAVGIPSLLLVLPMLLIREPERGQSEDVTAEELGEYLKNKALLKNYLSLVRNGSYVCDSSAMILMTFVTGAFAWWGPTYFNRIRGLDLDKANYYFGIATLLAGILGTFFGGWIADVLQKRIKSAYFLVSGVGMLLGVPALLAVMLIDIPQVYWPCVFFAEFCLFLNTGPANAIILNVTSPNMRAGAFALNIFLIHALGDVISPAIVGAVSDATNLHFALVTIMPIVTVAGGLAYLMGMRYLESDMERALQEMRGKAES